VISAGCHSCTDFKLSSVLLFGRVSSPFSLVEV
jgi:hypothetical protein